MRGPELRDLVAISSRPAGGESSTVGIVCVRHGRCNSVESRNHEPTETKAMKTIATIDLASLTTVTGGAGGKAYTFTHDSKTDRATCFATADRVGKSYGLQMTGTGSARSLRGSDGEQAGTAYTERGNCHIDVN
jgi:hypothetical protein